MSQTPTNWLDELIAQAQLEIKTEPDDFLFDSLNCGDLFTPTSSQQTAGGTQADQTIGDPDGQSNFDSNSYHLDHSQSGYSQSTYSLSTYSQPTYSQSSYYDSTLSQPSYSQPSYSQSSYSQSSHSQPSYSQSTYSPPADPQSIYSPNDQTVCSQENRDDSLLLFSQMTEPSSEDDQLDHICFDSNSFNSNSQIESAGNLSSSYAFGFQQDNAQQNSTQLDITQQDSSQLDSGQLGSTQQDSSQQDSTQQDSTQQDSTESSQASSNRSLFVDESSDVFRRTVLMRLEILMKVLWGKGLFFNDQILVAKKCWENANFEGSIRMNYLNPQLRYRRIQRASRIALLMMSAKIYLLVAENRITSRRQIYYEEQAVFNACKCYSLIEQVCAFVNLSRRELNIIATGKGLVAGNLVLLFENRTAIDVSQFKKGCLIPDSLIYLSGLVTNARYALLIEKDAIFAKLVDAGFHLLHNAILITSKGFPDVYTRELVNLLSDRFGLKTFGLFDCDPFGIEIFSCFKFGSVNLIHHSAQLSSPRIVWLGIYPSEIAFLRLRNVPLTETDERRLASLLKRAYLAEDPFLSAELIALSQIKVKSGLQDLENMIFGFILNKIGYYLPVH